MADDDPRAGGRPLSKPDYTALEFPAAPADRPYTILNMVSSADGKTVVGGTERGLGSPTDQRLMRELRVHADLVLNGAKTLRASGTSPRLKDPLLEELRLERGKSRLPLAAVLSGSGELPLDSAFFVDDDFEAHVFLSDAAPLDRQLALEATGRPVHLVPAAEPIVAMIHTMHGELGVEFLLVEGGATINGELLRNGLVDELFLTLGSVIVGGDHGNTVVEMPGMTSTRDDLTHLELLHAVPNPATSELYLRYRVLR